MRTPHMIVPLALAGFTFVTSASHAQQGRPEAIPAPRYSIKLGGRDACVTPDTRNRALRRRWRYRRSNSLTELDHRRDDRNPRGRQLSRMHIDGEVDILIDSGI